MSDVRDPPTTDGLPLVGDGWAFARDPVQAMESWARKGDLVRLRLPGQAWFLVAHPAMVAEVLVEKADRFTIGPQQRTSFEGVEDHAITTATGERWRRLRDVLSRAFTPERVATYGDCITERTRSFVDDLPDGERVDLHAEMRRLSVQVLADALLDVDVAGDEDVVTDASDALLDRADFRRPGQLLPDWVPTPTDRRFERTVGRLDEFVADLVSDRRSSGGGADVCSLLLAAERRDDLTPEELRHTLVALLLAGHESPGLALTFAWYLVSEHPDVHESLLAEYEAVADGRDLDDSAFQALERTRAVVRETLRLYPPTTGVNRQATEAVTVGGYDLPAGAQLLVPQWLPHRDERFWDDPESFDPSRWTGERDRPDFAYFPFSGGPRNCVGAPFARRELTLVLATMVGRLDPSVSVAEPFTFRPTIALRPRQDLIATVRTR